MAPFSRYCTLAFSLGAGVNNNRVNQRSKGSNGPASGGSRDIPCEGIARQSSPTFVASLAAPSDVLDDSLSYEPPSSHDVNLSQLSELLEVTPKDILRLKSSPDGVRGVNLNRNIDENEIILSIPLDSCLRDDSPPAWFLETHHEGDPAMQPSAWSSRLAAALIDCQLNLSSTSTKGMDTWLHLLPDSNLLRASLPIHWDEGLRSKAKCTALELAVDSAQFTRADAIADITMALVENHNVENTKEVCDNALDLVQTRSCRVQTNDGVYIRLLAPIFDFINHGSAANAVFALEDENLVVRATADLHADDQVLVDYGDSARPHWRCLVSYGFVPEYNEKDDDSNIAEVYVHGRRFEVGSSFIPLDLVEEVEAHVESDGFYKRAEVEEAPETVLTPDIALRIANRVSQVAFQLLLDPDQDEMLPFDDGDGAEEMDEEDNEQEESQTPEDVVSARLAAQLRFAQHRTLLACAKGLMDWREGNRTVRRRASL